VRRAFAQVVAAIPVAIGLSSLASLPASARDYFGGPLEIRIIGAGDEIRDFMAVSSEDRLAASELLRQIGGAMHGPAHFIEEAAATLPHYRIALTQTAVGSFATYWPRTPGMSFIYYPGGAGASFLMVEYSEGNSALQDRWIDPSPEVQALLQRHLHGLSPIGLPLASAAAAETGTTTAPWGIAIGAVLLAAFASILLEDRRRWQASVKRSAGRGTNRHS
jgi:hypothetical protein